MFNFLFTFIITLLIRRAQRMPYYHLSGYMERFWLVPYKNFVHREVDRHRLIYDMHDRIDGVFIYKDTVTDGTGPVSWWERPFSWLIQRFDWAIRVHHILRSDHGRDPHNHPWPYITVVLRGGYWETLFTPAGEFISKQWHGPGSVLRRQANTWHRLDVPDGQTAWTLFFTGKRAGSWGFNVNGTVVPHREYHNGNTQ